MAGAIYSLPADPHTHPGCAGQIHAGVHNAQFCIFCLRGMADRAELRAAQLATALREVLASAEDPGQGPGEYAEVADRARAVLQSSEEPKP